MAPRLTELPVAVDVDPDTDQVTLDFDGPLGPSVDRDDVEPCCGLVLFYLLLEVFTILPLARTRAQVNSLVITKYNNQVGGFSAYTFGLRTHRLESSAYTFGLRTYTLGSLGRGCGRSAYRLVVR